MKSKEEKNFIFILLILAIVLSPPTFSFGPLLLIGYVCICLACVIILYVWDFLSLSYYLPLAIKGFRSMLKEMLIEISSTNYKLAFFEFMAISTKIRLWFSFILFTLGWIVVAIMNHFNVGVSMCRVVLLFTLLSIIGYNVFARKINLFFSKKIEYGNY